MTVTLIEALLLAFTVGCAVAAALLRDVLGSIIAFAAYSLGISIIWIVLQAPDVGLTEAAVGAGVMTVLFLLTIATTVRPEGEGTLRAIHWPAVGIVVLFLAVLALTLPAFPEIGDPSAAAWANEDVTQYYLENAYDETGVKNSVTAVLAAYRGFDTFGEAVVVFAAGVSVLVVLRTEVFA